MVQDLCVIMLTAGITSLLFKLLKQPVILGYIVAGMLVGPYVLGDSWVDQEENVTMWGEIGVLFLLFAMGLEFSFKKLLQVGSTAIIAASTIVLGMMGLGFIVGRLFGWDEMNSLFLGGMLCMSSTTIVFKALDDMGLREQKFAKICLGILVVEDLFAVILMVLLSSIATSRSFNGSELIIKLFYLVSYLVLWFVMGIALLPTFLRKFQKHLNNETLTIFSIGLCLGMVLLAEESGFSSALGAFVMGSMLAETLEAERIEHLIEPVKNIFGAIFFVSVGMMINPSQLMEYWLPILILTCVVILGQMIFASGGTLLSGQSLRVSMQAGFSLVQVGEFAFIIAQLGERLGVTQSFLYPIVVAVSVVTTFLTPYIMKTAIPCYNVIDKRMSPGMKLTLENYAKNRNTVSTPSTFVKLIKGTLLHTFIFTVIFAFVFYVFFDYIEPWLYNILPESVPEWSVNIIVLLIWLTAASPIILQLVSPPKLRKEEKEIWHNGNVQKAQVIGMVLFRWFVAIILLSSAIISVFSVTSGIIFIITIFIIMSIVMSRRVRASSRALTTTFEENLSAREKRAESRRSVSRKFTDSLLSYDVHISEFDLPTTSTFCGKTLMQLDIRNKSGVSIVRIVRGGININIPGGKVTLYPGDKIIVAGDDKQIAKFKEMLDNSIQLVDTDKQERTHVTLEHFTINEGNHLVGVSIMKSGIREQAKCIVMGIERKGELITNPDPQLTFEVGDVVVAAGETLSIKKFVENNV